VDLIATSSDKVRVYKINEQAELSFISALSDPIPGYCQPICSMDWDANDTNIIASSSIDGVISLFDLNSEKITSKVLAHIGSANKIAFGPE
jgi:WD40 repeat protein